MLEDTIEIHAPVGPGTAQMLHAQADRRQRILDLVRNLARHFAPGEDALCPRELGNVIEGDHDRVGERR